MVKSLTPLTLIALALITAGCFSTSSQNRFTPDPTRRTTPIEPTEYLSAEEKKLLQNICEAVDRASLRYDSSFDRQYRYTLQASRRRCTEDAYQIVGDFEANFRKAINLVTPYLEPIQPGAPLLPDLLSSSTPELEKICALSEDQQVPQALGNEQERWSYKLIRLEGYDTIEIEHFRGDTFRSLDQYAVVTARDGELPEGEIFLRTQTLPCLSEGERQSFRQRLQKIEEAEI